MVAFVLCLCSWCYCVIVSLSAMHASLAGSWIQWFISCDEKILTILVHICPSNSQPQAKWMTDRRTRYVHSTRIVSSRTRLSVTYVCHTHLAVPPGTWAVRGPIEEMTVPTNSAKYSISSIQSSYYWIDDYAFNSNIALLAIGNTISRQTLKSVVQWCYAPQ